jgi:hypothetical protein
VPELHPDVVDGEMAVMPLIAHERAGLVTFALSGQLQLGLQQAQYRPVLAFFRSSVTSVVIAR